MKLNSVEKKEKNIVELTITIDKAEFDAATEKAYRQNVGKMSVPGFRKGKAPRKMLEKLYGESVFFEDAVNICYPDAYSKAVEESGIEAVGPGSIEVEELNENGFTFKALVPVKPEVTITGYTGLKAPKEEAKATDEEIDAEINRLAEQSARLVTVERAVKDGDTISLDFEGFIDGVAFDGGKGENFSLKIGSGMFIPGFEEQLVGKIAAEACEVNVTFPENYGSPDLAGKPAVFKCKVNEVKETELPVLDDEFAKDVSEFDTFAELKADLTKRMQEAKEKQAENAYEEALINEMLENLVVEIPEVMIESQLDRVVEDFSYRLAMQGMDINMYLQMNGMEMESFRKLFRDQAERQVKVRLALEQIAKNEKLEVSEEELEKEFASLAEQNKLTVERVKELLAPDSLKGDLMTQKAVAFIKENAKPGKAAPKKATKAKKDEAEAEEKPAKAEKADKPKKTTKKADKAE